MSQQLVVEGEGAERNNFILKFTRIDTCPGNLSVFDLLTFRTTQAHQVFHNGIVHDAGASFCTENHRHSFRKVVPGTPSAKACTRKLPAFRMPTNLRLQDIQKSWNDPEILHFGGALRGKSGRTSVDLVQAAGGSGCVLASV